MQLCLARSCGVLGLPYVAKYAGEPTTAMRRSGPMRTAIMSLATCSHIALTAADLADIEAAIGTVSVQGERYPAAIQTLTGR